ncbi:lipopolysaccharide biosynthesis protein [Chitinophaga parva]|uniref:Lipopolysaccharide biosynthesis protein n=1 Tax=Chitinophaga parva TaxID=2169414 RepID=A0A2T7BKC9_9BACT|nr:Wzz/FepE/Etk N-terminal domain-containing protein [Chitinophaga parva]PUZ28127.1 lipopolysaccharide biosynthesis protein [Chitinophaga parva]
MSSQQNMQELTETSEAISLKEVILQAGVWIKYLFKHWIWMLLAGVVAAAIGVGISTFLKKKYEAELTFILEDANSNPLSSYMGLASQFGFDLGGGASSGLFTGDNIIEFLQSRLIVEKTLLSTVNDGNGGFTLADRYISFTKMNAGWNEDLKKIHFSPGNNRNAFNITQDSILNLIYVDITEKRLKVDKTDPKLNFISVDMVTEDQLFSKVFVERLVDEAISYYVSTKTGRSKINIDRLQSQADSLEEVLNKRTYRAATVQDINLNPAKQVAAVGAEVASRDKMVIQTMYLEVVKNLELSKLTMAQETPIIQIIDKPIYPLKEKKIGPVKAGVIGFFLGAFLLTVVVFIKRIYQQIMA